MQNPLKNRVTQIICASALLVFLGVSASYASSVSDINGDGVVDQADLAIMIDQWGGMPGLPNADLNYDDVVNYADAGILFSSWGVLPTPTLSVSLVANPTGGSAPLNNVDLTVDISGTAVGDIRYRFDCTNDGTYELDVTNTTDPYTVVDLCDYPSAGSYTAKVVVDREGLSVQSTVSIVVGSPPPPASGSKLLLFGSNGWTPGAEAVINAMLGENAAAFIHTGDMDFSVGPFEEGPTAGPCSQWPDLAYYCQGGLSAHTEDERRAGYRGMMASITNGAAPLYVAWGNHEYDGSFPKGGLQTYYRDTYGEDFSKQEYYAFTIQTGAGPARIIVVATSSGLAEGSAQRAWLEAELTAAQSYAWRIVIGHTIPYNRFKPLPTLTQFPYQLMSDKKVDLYIGGHPVSWERSYQVTFINDVAEGYASVVDTDDSLQQGAGVLYLTAGGSGMHPYGTLYAPDPVGARSYNNKLIGGWTYGVVNWSTDGRVLTVTGKGLPGNPTSQYPTGPLQNIDSFTITKP